MRICITNCVIFLNPNMNMLISFSSMFWVEVVILCELSCGLKDIFYVLKITIAFESSYDAVM